MFKPFIFCFVLVVLLSACASSSSPSSSSFIGGASEECPLFARSIAGAQAKLR